MNDDDAAKIQTPEPGLHTGIPEHVYRRWDAANQSTLWTFRRSAAHARHEFLNPLEKPELDLGNAIHALLLEPASLEERYAVRPPGIDGRTKEGKAALAEFRAEAAGKIILDKRDVYETLQGIRDSFRDHALAYELVTKGGHTEVSALWRDPTLDVLCKGRMDRITDYAGWTWILDIKSTNDASPDAFLRSVVRFGYHLQAAFYIDGLETLAPRERRFAILAVEKEPPYAIALYELDTMLLEVGRQEYRRYLGMWKRCLETGLWPAYPERIETLEAPRWIENRLVSLEESR